MDLLIAIIITSTIAVFAFPIAQQAVKHTNKQILISTIKNNPDEADKWITEAAERIDKDAYDCVLDDNFYKKYASPTLYRTYKFEREFYRISQDSDETDVVAVEKLENLNSQFLSIKKRLKEHDEEAKCHAQREQMRTVTQVQQDKLNAINNINDFDGFDSLMYDLGLDTTYRETDTFFTNITDYIIADYQYDNLYDVYAEIVRRLAKTYHDAPCQQYPSEYLPFAYDCRLFSSDPDEDYQDMLEIIILNGTNYYINSVEDYEVDYIYDIYEVLTDIDEMCQSEAQSAYYLADDTKAYYKALCKHVENNEALEDIELDILQQKIDENTRIHNVLKCE